MVRHIYIVGLVVIFQSTYNQLLHFFLMFPIYLAVQWRFKQPCILITISAKFR
jgi:hypothetical protein